MDYNKVEDAVFKKAMEYLKRVLQNSLG